MDLRLSDDQIALATELEKLAGRYAEQPIDFHGFALVGEALDAELAAAEFFDIAAVPELGPVSAALAVERLARLPYTAEIALSMLVRPQLEGDWPRPLAVVERDRSGNSRPGRFVASAATLLVIDGDNIGRARAGDGLTEPVESIYAYPMGRLTADPDITPLSTGAAARVRSWLRVALAAESAGLMQAAIDAIVAHLSVREQFGRPLGSFQALRHRMAECSVLAGGVRWLALRAAFTGDAGDAALAALHAQDSATRIVYDVHQMAGAMGMTLEFPLHLWTYRLKALLSELGGRGGQAAAVAEHCFAQAGEVR